MAKFNGLTFLLQLGDGATPEVFTTVAGMRDNTEDHNTEAIDVTDKTATLDASGNPWRELLTKGVHSMDISATGVFTDGATVTNMMNFRGLIKNFKLISAKGDTVVGAFQLQSMNRAGGHKNELTYSIKLASSGVPVITP
jgi:TP901-1 family phage major tail protein